MKPTQETGTTPSIDSVKDEMQAGLPSDLASWNEVEDAGSRRPDSFTCIEEDYCGKEEEKEISTESLVAVPCKCKSQWCKDCREGHAVAWREKLRPVVQAWPRVSMITLTIDRSLFDEPQEAYEMLQGKRAVAELIRKMEREGVIEDGRFFYAIEFHKDGGWIHWHLAVIPTKGWQGRMNDRRKWNGEKYLDRAWKWGHAWESTKKASSPEHAMNYLTKYIAKQDVEAPEWVLEWGGNFRKFSTSRGLIGCVKKRVEPKGGTRKRRTISERLAECKTSTKLLLRRIRFYVHDGEVKKDTKHMFVNGVDAPAELVERHPAFEKALSQYLKDGHWENTCLGLPFDSWYDPGEFDDWEDKETDWRAHVESLRDDRYGRVFSPAATE